MIFCNFTEIIEVMEKIIMSVLLLLPFVVVGQERNYTIFKYSTIRLSTDDSNDINVGYKPKPKIYFSSSLDNDQIIDKLNNSLTKIKRGKQILFYTKNEFSGLYNVYSSVNGEVRLQSSYINTFDFTPTCFTPGPVSNGDAGDLVGAIIKSILSDMDLKIRVSKRHTISFF
jgi:hypothetical protein